MAERIIFCCRCNRNVGTIRDAKLMVGLSFTCPKCVTIDYDNPNDFFNTTTANKGYRTKDTEDFMDIFKDIFKT